MYSVERDDGPNYCHVSITSGYRAAEEGAGAVGEEVPMEEHTVSVRAILHFLVLTVHPAVAQDQARELSVQCVRS